jgi:hypothetical protein
MWLMRRPWMKAIQRGSLKLLPASKRERARIHLVRQNQFARRHALAILVFSVNVVLASFIISVAYFTVLNMLDSGVLAPPKKLD